MYVKGCIHAISCEIVSFSLSISVTVLGLVPQYQASHDSTSFGGDGEITCAL